MPNITCAYCGEPSEKPQRYIDRANARGLKMYCNMECTNLALPNAILTETQVSSIKASIFKGDTIEQLAAEYEVNYRTISHIKCGRTWEEVAWPDGSKGAIPNKKRVQIVRLRMQQRSKNAKAARMGNPGARDRRKRK